MSALVGAAGLATGTLDLGTVNGRLPFNSPVLGGFALAVWVGVPATALARLAWRGHARTDRVAVVVGVALIGWILVELAFIRELSFFHPLYLGLGAGLVAAGRRTKLTDTACEPAAARRAGAPVR